MNITFEGKVALVTGAASGIGLETARLFAEAGAAVMLADINEEAAIKAAGQLSARGYPAAALGCDVAQEQEVAAMVRRTVATFGRLDFAFNNAGIQVPVSETADALGEDFDRTIAVNLRGVWSCMKYELQQLRSQGEGGAIVNCSSQSGLIGNANLGAYCASKHGVIGLTKSAALEYAPRGVRINAICPGAARTPMVEKAIEEHPEHMDRIISEIPLQRLATSEEIASVVIWLCSPAAGFMVGQSVTPDGGYTIK
jgi:NAD(P)-dependent dehydrogenase (short-subunit alcohol dehydrogenase family)